ncbi:MAG: hypothetical protein IMF11_16415 [Proteobacteria bacterium]|jgi:hypothetical protein|nr:hypothetical protein [Pseudomonadota bacterium]
MSVYKRKEESLKGEHRNYNEYIKRARYFHGMLMTEGDFEVEQIYLNEKRKLLNQTLHGWGVVCGLKVKPTTTAGPNIIVEPGLALDCHGNEILVCEEQTIDLSAKVCTSTQVQEQANPCVDPQIEVPESPTLYVMIKYKDRITDQVSVYAPGGSCEEKVCNYSRTQEGYCIEVWDSLNNNYLPPPVTPESGEVCKDPFPCPDINCCPDQHYILLATISCGSRKDRLFGKLVATSDGSEIRYWVERTLSKVCIIKTNPDADEDIITVTDKYAFETVGPINIAEESAIWTLDWTKLKNLEVVGNPVGTLQGREPVVVTYHITAKDDGAADGVLKVPITKLDCDTDVSLDLTGEPLKSTIRIGTTDVERGKTISEAMIRNLEQRKYVATFPWFARLSGLMGEELPWSGDLSAYCTAEEVLQAPDRITMQVARVREDIRKEMDSKIVALEKKNANAIKKIETEYEKKLTDMDKAIKGLTKK